MQRSSFSAGCLFSLLLSASCGGSGKPEAATQEQVVNSRAGSKARAARAAEPELDPGQIVLGLRGHEADLRACFDRNDAPQPAFVELAFNVNPEGEPRDIRESRSLAAAPEIIECLSENLATARFGRPGRTLAARWTFVGGLVRFEDAEARRRKRGPHKRDRGEVQEREVVIEESSPGKLDPDKVQSIVQSGYKLFAHCYRDGLDRDPKLGGAVRLRFVIGAAGSVARVIDGGSDIPDPGVVTCIAESFFALRFPKPAGGNVHLRYRIHFDAS
ncbi:MAG TPA: AgmX/PglI C-terminal domain-containing protein [Polyangiaceae bacterium]|nr:AgmX/PglI C-terminal domain-containing protein [Polyangiaceae bacterium]